MCAGHAAMRNGISSQAGVGHASRLRWGTRNGRTTMPRRYRRHVRIEQLGESKESSPGRIALILSVPVLSLVLPALAVAIADAGGKSEPVRIAADINRFLLFYSGVFALVALTAAVGAGLLASDRVVMSPEKRILSQGLHRMISLFGISALANHIMLEILAHRVNLIDGFVPFLAARRTFFMGLGTLASDLFIVVIITGIMRARFATAPRWLWRALHSIAYVAWVLGILHGLLAGRSAKPYVDWSYGACVAFASLALIFRIVMQSRGRNSAEGLSDHPSAPLPSPFPPQPRAAQIFAGYTDGGITGTLPPALPAGQSARAPRPGHQAWPWPMPEYDPDWQDLPDWPQWPDAPLPYGRER
jgi:hypothetical protein